MGDILKTKGGLVIDRPGNVVFIPVKADGTLDYANAIRNSAVINTITITNSSGDVSLQGYFGSGRLTLAGMLKARLN